MKTVLLVDRKSLGTISRENTDKNNPVDKTTSTFCASNINKLLA